jgi:NAD(P)-dependent dehydrogenase (short-subunit alcohol dehydrogenase family)
VVERGSRTVLVTGGAGGLGAATVGLLADLGWHVFCADLGSPELARVGSRDGVTPLVLDVTDADSVAAAARLVGDEVDGLDAVVNFAGVLGVGSVLEIEEAELRRVLDVNVLGTYRVNRAFFPLVHRRRGRIVNISSETGHQQGAPFNGAYAMSKHAVEAYSDSLRRELRFLGVEVVKLRPGPFRTGMVGGIERAFTRAAEASTYFPRTIERVRDLAVRENDKANDPVVLARAVHRALVARRPRAAYPVREDRGRALLDRLPTRLSDLILEKVMTPRDDRSERRPSDVEWV